MVRKNKGLFVNIGSIPVDLRGVRHDLHREKTFAILDGGKGSRRLTQPLKGMSDASIQEVSP